MIDVERLREALSRISEISRSAASDDGGDEFDEVHQNAVCTPKALPVELQVRAARTATDVNPVNAPIFGFIGEGEHALAALISDPHHAAAITSKYWGPAKRQLTVSFMTAAPRDLRNRIVQHMNAWRCGIEFVETMSTGQVRISLGPGGYWSYVGTDILHIAPHRPTMNLEGFTMEKPESEFRRVVRHEAGHTLGFPHEHVRREIVARIDREKAYAYFARTQGWGPTTVDQQVLTPLEEHAIISTAADQTSIMCYQLPGEIMRDGRPVPGGKDINTTDLAFAQRIYPPMLERRRRSREEEGLSSQAQVPQSDEFVYEPAFAD